MQEAGFRDDLGPFLGSRKDRRKVLREVIEVERQELGLPPLPKEHRHAAMIQAARMERISKPKVLPKKKHESFLRAPSSLRGKSSKAKDELFIPSSGQGDFWLYGMQKVTQSTLFHLANVNRHVTDEELFAAPVCVAVKKKVDSLMHQAASMERCGLLFDIVSTSKIIKLGIPHRVGALIYDYVEKAHGNVTSLKFVFVGITDNVNCCAARDVFCRDEVLTGKYIGQTKRTFDALDNVHMFPVIPVLPHLRESVLGETDDLPQQPKPKHRAATPAGPLRPHSQNPSSGDEGSFFMTQQSVNKNRPASVM
jgi:hypothetical protein